ncbi:MAG TPA: GAF domain-containing protein, partial [Chloroflexota bacterium]|nr:GAF domain-containing protein [Chloroflexota bacterium]
MSERLLRAVRDTHALLAATRDVAAAARVVAEQVVDVLDAAAAIICIPDGAAGLRVAYATRRWAGVPHDAPRFVLRLCDEARQQGQTITRPMPELEAVTRDVPRVSAVPVHHADHVVAVIGVGWPSSGTELGAVQLLSAPLGPALELLRQASDLSTATQIATALLEFLCRDVRSILDEADVQHLALRLATKVLQPASAAIWLFEPDQSLRCSAGVGYPRRSDGELVPLNEVLTRQAAVDVVNLAQAAHTGGLACSYLGVPIQRHGRSLGALEIIGAAGRHYRPEEEALLIGLASG